MQQFYFQESWYIVHTYVRPSFAPLTCTCVLGCSGTVAQETAQSHFYMLEQSYDSFYTGCLSPSFFSFCGHWIWIIQHSAPCHCLFLILHSFTVLTCSLLFRLYNEVLDSGVCALVLFCMCVWVCGDGGMKKRERPGDA